MISQEELSAMKERLASLKPWTVEAIQNDMERLIAEVERLQQTIEWIQRYLTNA